MGVGWAESLHVCFVASQLKGMRQNWWMRAAWIDALGDPYAIRYGELPDPSPAAGQVLVRVEAVAVDAVDTLLRSGKWQTPLTFPITVGRDLVGTVAELGPGITDMEPGEWVWTNSAGFGGRPGATAELVPVDRERLYRLPVDADPINFVASVHPGATAHGALYGRARLQPVESIAVVGANGSVGMCMVQAAALRGAEVVAVVRHEGATDRMWDLGASHVVVTEAADTVEASAGVDIFVDTTGHANLSGIPEQLNPRGRAVVIAGRGDALLDMWQLQVREIEVLGFVMSSMTVGELASAAAWINGTHPKHPLTVDVGDVLGFQDAARAHTLIETGQLPHTSTGTVGRLVLCPNPCDTAGTRGARRMDGQNL